MPLLAIF